MKYGAALPMALFALCLIGALTVGGAFVTRRFVDDARVDDRAQDLTVNAERALAEAVGSGLPPMALGATEAGAETVTDEVRIRLWRTRISDRLVWVVAEASRTRKPLLRKRIAVLLQIDTLGVVPTPQVAWFDLP